MQSCFGLLHVLPQLSFTVSVREGFPHRLFTQLKINYSPFCKGFPRTQPSQLFSLTVRKTEPRFLPASEKEAGTAGYEPTRL